MEKVPLHQFPDTSEAALVERAENKKQSEKKTIDRRSFLGMAASLAALTGMARSAFARNFEQGEPTRYPDPDIIALDKRFNKYKIGNTPIQRLYRGTLWAE